MNQKANFVFSQEELLYLLRTLTLPDLPGMGDKPWGHIPQEQVLLVMETVGRGLLACQVIQFGEYAMKVDEAVTSLLASCASPQQMLLLSYSQGNETITHNFFRGQVFDVEHDLPHPWVHRFQQTEKSDMGLSLLRSLVDVAPDGASSAAFEVNQAELDEIRQGAAGDPEKAAQALQSKGLPADEAGRLARVFAAPTIKMLVMAFQQINPEPQGSVFSLLADAESTWLVSAGKPGDPLAQVRQVGRQELVIVISETFEKFSP